MHIKHPRLILLLIAWNKKNYRYIGDISLSTMKILTLGPNFTTPSFKRPSSHGHSSFESVRLVHIERRRFMNLTPKYVLTSRKEMK